MKFRSLCFIVLTRGIRFTQLVYTWPWTSKFSCSFFYNNGVGLQMPTGPSSGGVVPSILLVSSRLDCPGMSLAEVCATCLEMSMWSFSGGVTLKCCSSKLFFIIFKKYKQIITLRCYPIILMSKKIPISCSTNVGSQNFNIHHNKSFIVYKMAMGLFFTNLKKS